MNKNRFNHFLVLLAALVTVSPAGAQTSPVPSDAEIRKILVDRIDVQKQSVGIVVGVIEPSGRRVVSYGRLAKNDPRPLNGDTLYEIGSITKVFTSLLLAEAVERGEVTLTDPVGKFLPAAVKVPERGGRSITLQDLATHTSGLPRMPNNFAPKDPANPYADYSAENLYAFLSGYQLTRDIGTEYEYSNLGGGLLGHALTLRARDTDYESLVHARVIAPLGMTSTAITLTPDLKARLAGGHGATLQPVANWDLAALAGAGALRSTTNDLLTFLAANLGYVQTPLAPAMAAMLKVRRPTTSSNLAVALGWHVFSVHDKEIVWHNGGTAGYRTFIGFDPKARVGVVVLSNAGTPAGPDDIGRHLLDSESPLLGPQGAPKTRTEIAIDPQLFDKYVGRYQLAPSAIIAVTRDGSHLFVQLTGQPKFEVFPEGAKDFFLKVVDAQITFEAAGDGNAQALVLHQNGANQRAKRIAGEPVVPKEIALDPKTFDAYVGRYELRPGLVMTMTRDDQHLYTQLTGQPRFEVFASGPREFFLKAVDAQLTFEVGADGGATTAILHQNGRDIRAARIE
jgi:D-alanyl-D-alanine-carboxypeptidase/D-alanyl-D-alanine-endopeptidase